MNPMRLIVLSLSTFLLTVNALAAGAAPRPATPTSKPSIFICGDSTSKYNGSETMQKLTLLRGKEMAGWGTPIAQFFDPEKVNVVNVGHAGTSSLSYYNGDWPKVLPRINAGDFVLIVFGINDGSTPNGIGDETREGRGGAIQHTYGWYMSKMATDAKEKGAHPIFLTVTTRNMWTNPKVKFNDAKPIGELPGDYDAKEDRIERGTANGRYTQWTKDVAAKLKLPVFDLTNYCADLYETMGRTEVDKMYSDHNHTYLIGAETVAKAVVAGLKGIKESPFIPLLSENGKAVPAADAKYISDNR